MTAGFVLSRKLKLVGNAKYTEVFTRPKTTSLLVAVYLVCFLPESVSETIAALRVFNWVDLGDPADTSDTFEKYGHVVMAVILPVLSSALNFCVHFRDIIRYPTMIEYETSVGAAWL